MRKIIIRTAAVQEHHSRKSHNVRQTDRQRDGHQQRAETLQTFRFAAIDLESKRQKKKKNPAIFKMTNIIIKTGRGYLKKKKTYLCTLQLYLKIWNGTAARLVHHHS